MIKKFILAAIFCLALVGYKYTQDLTQQGPHTPLEWAYSQIGVRLAVGDDITNPLVMDYVHSEPNGYEEETDLQVEENSWCGFFVAWCLQKAGYNAPEHPELTAYWRDIGIPILKPSDVLPGDVVLISGHVTFVYSVDLENRTIIILGGNQGYLGGPPCGVNFQDISFDDVKYVIRPVKVQDHPGHK